MIGSYGTNGKNKEIATQTKEKCCVFWN